MITASIATLVFVILVSFVTLHRAAKRAPEGYQDDSGFHFGRTPPMARTARAETASPDSYDQGIEIPAEEAVVASIG